MPGKGGRKKKKLTVYSVGLDEAQDIHVTVLMRITGKSRSRIIREAVDYYFANYRVSDGRGGTRTLGDAEADYLRSEG